MDLLFLIGWLMLLLVLHEMGHLLYAMLNGFTIEGLKFDFKPFPRLYVEIIDRNITALQRTFYLLSGSWVTFILFAVFLLSGWNNPVLLDAFVLEIISETNPFMSDYQSILFRVVCRKQIRDIVVDPQCIQKEEAIQLLFKEDFLGGKYWFIHFFIWAALVIFLLANVFVKLNA